MKREKNIDQSYISDSMKTSDDQNFLATNLLISFSTTIQFILLSIF